MDVEQAEILWKDLLSVFKKHDANVAIGLWMSKSLFIETFKELTGTFEPPDREKVLEQCFEEFRNHCLNSPFERDDPSA